jgi:phosphoribosylformylglycinamidine synthase
VGGLSETFVFRNLTPHAITESIDILAQKISDSQILAIPGGFSGSAGGGEPMGSGKFIAAILRNPKITEAIRRNGFQALVKLGLVPYGEIREQTCTSPALTFNSIGRHQAVLVNTKIVSNKSPWLSHMEPGEQFIVPVSHGEGRFVADEPLIRSLAANGQIAAQYVDFDGNASQDIRFNPNNSSFSIEGITSPDGRIFGCMAHNERFENGLLRNIPGIRKRDIFAGAVRYFRD